jgi:HAD superfamily hydrolase (TIGR01509 family)
MVKAVIFDMDGTLVDSVGQHARAWQDAFAEFGHRIALAELRGQIGKGGDQLMPCFLSADQLAAQGARISARRGEIMKERYLAEVKPFPSVRALLERVRARRIRIVLASSAQTSELSIYKRLAQIEDLVDAETSSDDVEKSKPHPDVFLAALAQLDPAAREDAVAVGDSPYDAQAAGKAGLRCVGFLCGGFAAEDLRAAGCVALYDGPADLLARFDESLLGGE